MDRPRNNKGRFLRGIGRVVLISLITPFTPFQGVVRDHVFTNPLVGRTTRGGKVGRIEVTTRSKGKVPTTNAMVEIVICSTNLRMRHKLDNMVKMRQYKMLKKHG